MACPSCARFQLARLGRGRPGRGDCCRAGTISGSRERSNRGLFRRPLAVAGRRGKMTPGKKRKRSSRSWNAFKVLATSAGQRPLPTGQIQEQVACQLVKTRRKSGKSIGHRQILWNSDRKQEDSVRWSTLQLKIKRSFSVPREDTCLTLPRQSKTVPFPPGEIP